MGALGWITRITAGVILGLILTQNLQIYAELLIRWLDSSPYEYLPPPPGSNATDHFATASDGEQIHFRRWPAAGPPQTRLRVAILNHGNAGTMDRYSTIPKWLSGLGVTTYVYDYRGYGQSTGFPSERGLYRDVEAVWAEAQKRDQATPRQTLVFGHSLGGGPAAYLAEKYELAVLVTAAAFTSLPERIHSDPTFGPLSPFVFDRYPNTDRIRRLKSTRLIVLHAAHDHGMPRWMAEKLKNAYRGSAGAHLIESPTAGHGDIISQVPQLAEPFLRDLQ